MEQGCLGWSLRTARYSVLGWPNLIYSNGYEILLDVLGDGSYAGSNDHRLVQMTGKVSIPWSENQMEAIHGDSHEFETVELE